MSGGGPSSPSLRARAVGVFVSALIVSTAICLATYGLRLIRFEPLQRLMEFDDRVYDIVLPPPPIKPRRPIAVVFIDIGADDMRAAGARPGARTPRDLIASVTRFTRDAGAAVVFLDFDLRDALDGADNYLRAELVRSSPTPVLLQESFLRQAPDCGAQTGPPSSGPVLAPSAFDDLLPNHGSLMQVHAVMDTSAYGVITGTCSAFRTEPLPGGAFSEIPAAMEAAMSLAGAQAAAQVPDAAPHLIPVRWRIGDKQRRLETPDGHLLYLRLSASALAFRGASTDALKGAAVIIGASHDGADDTQHTAIGDMPGAVVHANIALGLQTGAAPQISMAYQFAIDIVLIFSACALSVRLVWLPVIRRFEDPHDIPFGVRVWRITLEFFLLIVTGALLLAAVCLADFFVGSAIYAWRFGLLSFILSALAGFAVEVTTGLADAAGGQAQRSHGFFWSRAAPVAFKGEPTHEK